MLHADGHIVWVRDQARWVADESGQALFEGVFADVTERKRAELELTHTAQHDPLTGLVNRRQFTRQLEHELEHGAAAGAAVLFVDIDRFKLVNDGHGHDAGDEVLREAGRRLAAALRAGSVLSRFGGDEFTAYVPDCDAAGAEVIAQRILTTLARPFPVARGEVYVGGSVGIALTDGDARSATDLIRDADVAMYVAKQSGPGAPRALRREPARGIRTADRDGQRPAPGARAGRDRAAAAADRRSWRRAPGRSRGAAALAPRRRARAAARVRVAGRGGGPDRRDRALRPGRGLPDGPAPGRAARRADRGQRQRLAAARAAGRPRDQRGAGADEHGLRSGRACSSS